MESRGQKRTETAEELPADKRACSSLEFRPSSSIRTHLNSPISTPDADMETSSSASASSRSEDEENGDHDDKEEDSAYGSCDSEDAAEHLQPRHHHILRDYQRRRSSGDHRKLTTILSNLNQQVDGCSGQQLAMLTELCEVLSFCNEDSLSSSMADSLSSSMADSLSSVLVKLAKDVLWLLTELC